MKRQYKILITRRLLDTDKNYITDKLRALVGDCFDLAEPKTWDEEGILEEVCDADALLGPFVTQRILERAGQLKFIQVPWTGMDNFNFDAIRNCGVPVCNSHSNSTAVAEMAVGLLLDLMKKISYHDGSMRRGDWNRSQGETSLKSRILAGSVACILGYGEIGKKVSAMLKAFGVKIKAVNSSGRRGGGDIEMFPAKDALEAARGSDIVICALPLTDATRGMINKDFLSALKKECMLVNVSRADIVEEDDLYQALLGQTISGYASDVWWKAPERGASESWPSEKNEFWRLPNVVMSPHRAGFIEGALPHLDDAVKNIANMIDGKEFINVVSLQQKY